MIKNYIRRNIISFFLISFLFFSSFFGFLVFEGMMNIGSIEAATTRYVGGSGPGNYSTIGNAILVAQPGDTIRVYAGIYNENIIINKKINLIGNGSINTTINGGGINNVIKITSNLVNISGFLLKNSGTEFSPNERAGIKLDEVNNVLIKNNNISYNQYGILIYKSNSIDIIDNMFFNNSGSIYLERSKSNKIMNNSMVNCSLFIDGNSIEQYDSHIITKNNTVNKKPLYYLKNKTGYIIPKNAGQVILVNCTSITIKDQNFSNIHTGNEIVFSNNNIIKNNNYIFNDLFGIYLKNSNFNILQNNTCNSGNFNGMYILNSNTNTIKNNICNSNNATGISISYSNKNKLFNNTCNLNQIVGISVVGSSGLGTCNYNIIVNNTCNSNGNYESGIYLYKSNSNIINNNFCLYNYYGFQFVYSNNNTIVNNTCISNNWTGIHLEYSYNNTIFKNFIYKNNEIGFSTWDSDNNYFFHNNILYNIKQAEDNGNNFWNNSVQEGNYWSDYNGSDTGNKIYSWDITGKHLITGDGIGDTEVPHLDLDYYPFCSPFGWLPPEIPKLNDPGNLSSNGSYSISWENVGREAKYILEEDINESFNLPTIIFQSFDNFTNLIRKGNRTYYYRVRARNNYGSSNWSNIENITVDWPPNIPKNLSVSTYPPGNTLNLTWEPNLIDTNQYILEYKNETMANWQQINPISHPGFTYNHTGLIDGEKYYYRIQARDIRGHLSNFSDIICGIPWDSVPPAPTTGLRVVSTTNDSISLKWNQNTEDDLEGYHLFRSKILSPNVWGEPIGTIPKGTEEFIDTGLDEETTYYYVLTAFDEVPNNSSYSNIAFGTTILGPHGPVINNSVDDFSIPEDTIDDSTINLYYWFKDINYDPLGFKCKDNGNISVTIFQENGTVILIPKKDWNGKETLIFYANDSIFEISDDIVITVTPMNDPPGPASIITPEEGIKVENGTKINFSGICDDVDLIYGDILTFNWSSNISGRIGSSENLTDIILQHGQYQITLEVSDIAGETSIAMVNITILPEYIPKFEIKLELVPNIVELKSGEQTSIRAIVTNLGEVDDRIVLNIPDQDIEGLEVAINEPKIKDVILNGTAEFNITIKALDNAKKGENQITIVAASAKAAEYKIIEEDKVTLTVQILEKEKQGEDKLSTDYWIILLIIIIIIIILIIVGLLIKRKKQPKPEEPPTEEVTATEEQLEEEEEDALAELSQEE